MFEAFARNKYTATGVIQWMLNNAWPSMIWHLYDYYLRPGGGYYGTKKACEPVHVQYSYDDRSVVIVSDRLEAVRGLKVKARVLDLGLAEKFAREATVDVPADGVVRAFEIPVLKDRAGVFRASTSRTRQDRQHRTLLAGDARRRVDWAKTEWFYAVKQHLDLTAFARLPPPRSRSGAAIQCTRSGCVRVSTRARPHCFQVRLKLTEGTDGASRCPSGTPTASAVAGRSREVAVSYSSGRPPAP